MINTDVVWGGEDFSGVTLMRLGVETVIFEELCALCRYGRGDTVALQFSEYLPSTELRPTCCRPIQLYSLQTYRVRQTALRQAASWRVLSVAACLPWGNVFWVPMHCFE